LTERRAHRLAAGADQRLRNQGLWEAHIAGSALGL